MNSSCYSFSEGCFSFSHQATPTSTAVADLTLLLVDPCAVDDVVRGLHSADRGCVRAQGGRGRHRRHVAGELEREMDVSSSGSTSRRCSSPPHLVSVGLAVFGVGHTVGVQRRPLLRPRLHLLVDAREHLLLAPVLIGWLGLANRAHGQSEVGKGVGRSLER